MNFNHFSQFGQKSKPIKSTEPNKNAHVDFLKKIMDFNHFSQFGQKSKPIKSLLKNKCNCLSIWHARVYNRRCL